MVKQRLSLILFLTIIMSFEVSGQWDQYEAVWKGKPGLMLVNMDIASIAPIPDMRYLLEVSQSVRECNEDGYPTLEESNWSEIIAARIDSIISIKNYVENVGRHTYQCKIKEYYYLQDTVELTKYLSENLSFSTSFKIVEDEKWKVYKDFIYPDEYLIQTMDNRKIIGILQKEGYDLEKKSSLTHFASFASEEDRNKFRRFLIEQNFKILEMQTDDSAPLAYLVSFSRSDKLHLGQLSNITLRVHQRAISLNGTYDGWEIELE